MKNRRIMCSRTIFLSSLLSFAVLSSAVLGGCSSKSDVEKAAIIATEIKKAPKKAEAILKEHDMSIDEFEKVMYDIAADPELSKQYEEARKTAN